MIQDPYGTLYRPPRRSPRLTSRTALTIDTLEKQETESMANDLEAKVWEALKAVRFPGMSRDIVSFGFVHDVKISGGGEVEVSLQMATHNPEAAAII